MDAGDIAYLIVAAFLMLFSFIAKQRKEKNAKKNADEDVDVFEIPDIDMYDEEAEAPGNILTERESVPPIPVNHPPLVIQQAKPRSDYSMKRQELVSSIEGQSSLRGSLFLNDSVGGSDNDEKMRTSPHPFLKELQQGNVSDELRKGIIYAEILCQKF